MLIDEMRTRGETWRCWDVPSSNGSEARFGTVFVLDLVRRSVHQNPTDLLFHLLLWHMTLDHLQCVDLLSLSMSSFIADSESSFAQWFSCFIYSAILTIETWWLDDFSRWRRRVIFFFGWRQFRRRFCLLNDLLLPDLDICVSWW